MRLQEELGETKALTWHKAERTLRRVVAANRIFNTHIRKKALHVVTNTIPPDTLIL